MFKATLVGFRRVLGSPALLAGAWLLTVLAALPATFVLGSSLHGSFGHTLAAERMGAGFDHGWHGDYLSSARGLESTFDPTAAGVGGVLSNLEGWVDGSVLQQFAGLIGLGLLFALVWALFMGGAIERYAFSDAPRGIVGMLNSGGRYWLRFVRLSLLAALAYYAIYRLHGFAMERVGTGLTDVTQERSALTWTLTVYAATALLLVWVRACVDYAKIAIVIDDRRSALLAAIQGVAFVVTHPFRTTGLLLAIAAIGALPLALYIGLRPSVITPGWSGVIQALLIGQVWIFTRLTLRLALMAGQTALYQSVTGGPGSSSSRGR